MAIEILDEPTGSTYRQLVDLALEHCQTFSLVWRDGEPCDSRITERLGAHLIREARVDSWPGTQLLGDQATIRYFQLSDLSAALLKTAPSLYAWQHPQRPEDLIFYAQDVVWMGSIAHEGQAWFEAHTPTAQHLQQAIPTLRVNSRDA